MKNRQKVDKKLFLVTEQKQLRIVCLDSVVVEHLVREERVTRLIAVRLSHGPEAWLWSGCPVAHRSDCGPVVLRPTGLRCSVVLPWGVLFSPLTTRTVTSGLMKIVLLAGVVYCTQYHDVVPLGVQIIGRNRYAPCSVCVHLVDDLVEGNVPMINGSSGVDVFMRITRDSATQDETHPLPNIENLDLSKKDCVEKQCVHVTAWDKFCCSVQRWCKRGKPETLFCPFRQSHSAFGTRVKFVTSGVALSAGRGELSPVVVVIVIRLGQTPGQNDCVASMLIKRSCLLLLPGPQS